jgi:hypothetical protein
MNALGEETGGLVPVTAGGAVVKSTRDWLASIDKATIRCSYRTGLRDFASWLGMDVVGEPFHHKDSDSCCLRHL